MKRKKLSEIYKLKNKNVVLTLTQKSSLEKCEITGLTISVV